MNQLTSEKKQKLLEVIYKGDLESIAKFAHDTTYLNACLSDQELTFLHFVCNMNASLIAPKINKPIAYVQNELKNIVIALLDKNHEVNLKDKNGRLPLHYACCQGNAEIIKILLQKNIKTINALTIGDETPLMKAVYFQKIESIKVLLEYGADITIKNRNGKIALDYASMINNENIKKLLNGAYHRYRSRINWIFVINSKYCKTKLTWLEKIGKKQKDDIIDFI